MEPNDASEKPSRANAQGSRRPCDRFEQAFACKDLVVSALAMTAESLTSSHRNRLLHLSNEIAYAKSSHELLSNPLSLEIFLPLTERSVDADGHDRPIQQNDVDSVVCRVLQRQLSSAEPSPDRFSFLLYPLAVLLVSIVVLATISGLLVPEFERMFNEFGLLLPGATRLIIAVSHAMQSPVTWVLFIAIAGLFVWLSLRQFAIGWSRLLGPTLTSRRPAVSKTLRGAWADWAWHLSLLLESGFALGESLQIAGTASRHAALRLHSHRWAEQIDDGIRPFDTLATHFGQPCDLLIYALTMDAPDGVLPSSQADVGGFHDTRRIVQAKLLREVASIYWDRDRCRSTWWWSWLAPVVVICVGGVVGFVVLALFMPLVDLITGLS